MKFELDKWRMAGEGAKSLQIKYDARQSVGDEKKLASRCSA